MLYILRSRDWPQFFTLSLQTIEILREISQVPGGGLDENGRPRLQNAPKLEALISHDFLRDKLGEMYANKTGDFEEGFKDPIVVVNPLNCTVQNE